MTDRNRAVLYLRVSSDKQTKTAGDGIGFSIAAQEKRCMQAAEDMGVDVVEIYVELAESAKSAKRPELQRLMKRIREVGDVDHIILFKVDRWTRIRRDDALLASELQERGVTLISATENIDDTPEGQMMQGILVTYAEYENMRNAIRATSGMQEKARRGGTPWRAPVGYLNTTAVAPDGHEYRTVAVDEDRAPHITWAFQTYATGRYSLDDLVVMLDARGFRSKPRSRLDEPKPIKKASLGRVLRDPYYTGKMRYKGEIIEEGQHEALVSQQLFDRVQQILTAKNTSGTRRRVHRHPLKGLLICGHCGTQMYYSLIRNRHGSAYHYFRCRGRQDGFCDRTYVPYDSVVQKIQEIHETQSKLTDDEVEVLISWIQHAADTMTADNPKIIADAQRDIDRLERERRKLLRLHYDDVIDAGMFKEEQARIEREQRHARLRITEASTTNQDAAATVEKAIALIRTWPQRMKDARPEIQDAFHKAFYKHFIVESPREVAEVRTEPRHHTRQLMGCLEHARRALAANKKEPALAFAAAGSNMSHLVPGAGLEPARRLPSRGV